MPLNVENRLNVQQELSTIAEMAYGHGKGEGEAGGAGRIGLINGHVVKFNTSWQDRLFGARANDEMRKSCNDLRARFLDIARNAGLDEHAIGDIRTQLGLSREGTETATKKLLDRKVAAKVVNMISKGVSGEKSGDVWNAVTRSDVMRSSGDMSFDAVQDRVMAQSQTFNRSVGMSLAESIARHFPGVELTNDMVNDLLDGDRLASLCDSAKMKIGEEVIGKKVDDVADGIVAKLKDQVGAGADAQDRLAEVRREIRQDLMVRLVGAKTNEEKLLNPTGETVHWVENDDASKTLLDKMVKDAERERSDDFAQMAGDFERSWKFNLGGTDFQGKSGDKSPQDENSDFRKTFRNVFTDSKTGEVDTKAERFAARVMHQGLALGLSEIQNSNAKFLPVISKGMESSSFVSLRKSETSGRYVIAFSQTTKGFNNLNDYSMMGKFGYGAVQLKGDPKDNSVEYSYEFEFGMDKNGNPDCKMLQNVKGEMTIPTHQDIEYSDAPLTGVVF